MSTFKLKICRKWFLKFKNKIVITKIIFGNIKFSIIMDLNTEKISKRNTTKNFDMVKRKIIINNSKL
jgi:hypothetical protein